MVLAHARALLTSTQGVTACVDADLHDPDQIAEFFQGLELVEPGVVSLQRWRPDPP